MGTATQEPRSNGNYQEQPNPAQSTPPRRATMDLLEMVMENGVRADYVGRMFEQEIARDMFDQDYRLARIFAEAGIFADIKGTEEKQAIATAMTKIRLGRSWGMSEADSIQFIFFQNGRPTVMNELLASKMRDAGFDWDIDWEWDTPAAGKSKKCTGCVLWLKKWDEPSKQFLPILDRKGNPVCEGFTKADADAAMIWEKGKQIPLSEKWNFISWARDMYFWRALGRLKKFHCTNILKGALPKEEAQDAQDSIAPPIEQQRGSVEAAELIASRKISLVDQIKAITATMEEGNHFAAAMAAAFGEKKWKKYFTACDVAELEVGLAKLQEFAAAKPEPEAEKATDDWGFLPGPEENFKPGANITVKGQPYLMDEKNTWVKQ